MRNHLNHKFDRSRRWSRANPTGFVRPKRVSVRARLRRAKEAWRQLVAHAKAQKVDPAHGAKVDDSFRETGIDYSKLPLGRDVGGGQ